MTHRETKKEAKRQDNKSRKPEIVYEEEMEKQHTKGVITGSRR